MVVGCLLFLFLCVLPDEWSKEHAENNFISFGWVDILLTFPILK